MVNCKKKELLESRSTETRNISLRHLVAVNRPLNERTATPVGKLKTRIIKLPFLWINLLSNKKNKISFVFRDIIYNISLMFVVLETVINLRVGEIDYNYYSTSTLFCSIVIAGLCNVTFSASLWHILTFYRNESVE